jgi:hypothetical protein
MSKCLVSSNPYKPDPTKHTPPPKKKFKTKNQKNQKRKAQKKERDENIMSYFFNLKYYWG